MNWSIWGSKDVCGYSVSSMQSLCERTKEILNQKQPDQQEKIKIILTWCDIANDVVRRIRPIATNKILTDTREGSLSHTIHLAYKIPEFYDWIVKGENTAANSLNCVYLGSRDSAKLDLSLTALEDRLGEYTEGQVKEACSKLTRLVDLKSMQKINQGKVNAADLQEFQKVVKAAISALKPLQDSDILKEECFGETLIELLKEPDFLSYSQKNASSIGLLILITKGHQTIVKRNEIQSSGDTSADLLKTPTILQKTPNKGDTGLKMFGNVESINSNEMLEEIKALTKGVQELKEQQTSLSSQMTKIDEFEQKLDAIANLIRSTLITSTTPAPTNPSEAQPAPTSTAKTRIDEIQESLKLLEKVFKETAIELKQQMTDLKPKQEESREIVQVSAPPPPQQQQEPIAIETKLQSIIDTLGELQTTLRTVQQNTMPKDQSIAMQTFPINQTDENSLLVPKDKRQTCSNGWTATLLQAATLFSVWAGIGIIGGLVIWKTDSGKP